MPYVKWKAIPPVKGPDSQGVKYGNNKKDVSVRKKLLGKNKRVLQSDTGSCSVFDSCRDSSGLTSINVL